MAYTNSPLVSYTRISPNRTINRNHAIDTITIHCVVGQCSVETLGNIFAPESRQASCNYGIGADGRIGMYCEEKDRSWCSSNAANDHRAVTIEVASDTKHPYAVNDKAYAALIDLCTDICKRNGIKKLLWKADKSLIGQVDKQNMTVHRWFANKSCPGDYLYNRHSEIAELVNKRLSTDEKADAKGLQAPVFKDIAEADVIKKVGSLFTADQKASGVLASVSLAQFILESGYGKSELAQNANNVFGMKKSLSGNTWSGSSWDGKSVYTKETQEWDGSKYITITADFRKYDCVEKSIADHSAYLLGAKNGSKLRYDGLKDCTDYKKAVQIIKDGGYATSPTYVENICGIIEKWDLTQYDAKADTVIWYRVRKSWEDASSQIGAFKILKNAKACADKNPGYLVFDAKGVVVYGKTEFDPYLVRVSVADLNIRKGPGTNYAKTGNFTGIGVFTIIAEENGQGASRWGKLKSGAGWISLDYAKRI